MGFLTPLYIAGLAAIALPLVFHLIRRTPRGQLPFSSLMFLTPSPPRITRRSRLDQILLLLLRAAALALLALAFARPFFREAAQFSLDASQGQRVTILVDASASMQRGDLWRQAQEEVGAILEDLKPTDRVALFTFDREVRTLMDFDDQTEIDPRRRISLVERRLVETAPSWAATDLGGALVVAADRLEALDRGEKTESDVRRRVMLVSDLQQGADLASLQTYEWPPGVELEVKTLSLRDPTNAGVHLAGGVFEEASATDGDDAAAGENLYRIRVANSEDAAAEQYQLVWIDDEERAVGDAVQLYVPPGQSRVTRVRRPDDPRDLRLTLRGDAHAFDNTLYFAPPKKEEIAVAYLGEDAADDPQGIRYYLERAFQIGEQREVQVIAPQAHEPLQPPGGEPPRLVVVAQSLEEDRLAELRRYVERSGQALLVATEPEMAAALASLFAPLTVTVEEAAPADYALLGEIDFSHPLLAPFADPRYSDFTKIHFWKHRRLKFAGEENPDEAGDLRVLARFDNRDPAFVEYRLGAGRVYLLAASWKPEDSQLARSSKFVPLLLGMVGAADSGAAAPIFVNDRASLPPEFAETSHTVRKPDGTEIALTTGAAEFRETDLPGVYTVGEHRFAVNLDPAESETAPRSPEELEQYGVLLTDAARRVAEEQRQRQLRDVELEGRQKIWRWLLAAALVVLVIETWLAGRHSRRATQPPSE